MNDPLTDALERFEETYASARSRNAVEASTMALATADSNARPSVRMVNFIGWEHDGFAFFVNATSGKSHQVTDNPWASLCFYWPELKEQVIVEGNVVQLPDADADRLWLQRPRDKALMAWAQRADDSDDAVGDARERFSDQRPPRADHWVAYTVQPHRIEFWRASWKRLRDREAYLLTDDGWQHELLKP